MRAIVFTLLAFLVGGIGMIFATNGGTVSNTEFVMFSTGVAGVAIVLVVPKAFGPLWWRSSRLAVTIFTSIAMLACLLSIKCNDLALTEQALVQQEVAGHNSGTVLWWVGLSGTLEGVMYFALLLAMFVLVRMLYVYRAGPFGWFRRKAPA